MPKLVVSESTDPAGYFTVQGLPGYYSRADAERLAAQHSLELHTPAGQAEPSPSPDAQPPTMPEPQTLQDAAAAELPTPPAPPEPPAQS